MITLDDDLASILKTVGDKACTVGDKVCSEGWAVKTIVHLVMANQEMRQVIRVVNRLEPSSELNTDYNLPPTIVGTPTSKTANTARTTLSGRTYYDDKITGAIVPVSQGKEKC